MLRHFAVLTIAATAALAMFAQGENSAALDQARKAASAPRGGQTFASAKAAPKAVNGMNVAQGTKVDRVGSSNYNEAEESHYEDPVSGDVRNLDPQYRTVAPHALGGVGSPEPGRVQPPPQAAVTGAVQRDPSGIPLPPGQQRRGQPQGETKAAPPRAPSRQDIDAMMEASRQRSSRSVVEGTNAGGLLD